MQAVFLLKEPFLCMAGNSSFCSAVRSLKKLMPKLLINRRFYINIHPINSTQRLRVRNTLRLMLSGGAFLSHNLNEKRAAPAGASDIRDKG